MILRIIELDSVVDSSQVVSEHYDHGAADGSSEGGVNREEHPRTGRILEELVTTTVDKAVIAMRQSLTEIMMEGQTMAAQKMGAEFEVLSGRLEGRVSRSREYHESLINTMRNDQLQFQTEVRSTLTGFQSMKMPVFEKGQGSVNRGDPLTVSSNAALGVLGDERGKSCGERDWAGTGFGVGTRSRSKQYHMAV